MDFTLAAMPLCLANGNIHIHASLHHAFQSHLGDA